MSESKPWDVWVVAHDADGNPMETDIRDLKLEAAGVRRVSHYATEAEAEAAARDAAKALKDVNASPELWTVCYAKGRTNQTQGEGPVHTPTIVRLDDNL